LFFYVNFKNKENDRLSLKFQVYNNKISRKWYSALCEQIKKDKSVAEPDRFYNFPNNEWSETRIVNELNSCITAINSKKTAIEHRAYEGMDQEQLNILHHYFEELRGGIDNPTEFWKHADEQVQSALERYNIIIHRAEDFYNNQQNSGLSPRIVCTFDRETRYKLAEKDFCKFTLQTKFGEVAINYCEVGKPLFDVFRDDDDIVGEDNIKPLLYYSADFRVSFYKKDKSYVKKTQQQMNSWWRANSDYLKQLGFQNNNKKNSIGHIPVAIIKDKRSENEIIQLLSKYDTIESVEI